MSAERHLCGTGHSLAVLILFKRYLIYGWDIAARVEELVLQIAVPVNAEVDGGTMGCNGFTLRTEHTVVEDVPVLQTSVLSENVGSKPTTVVTTGERIVQKLARTSVT